eukprot:CAMPEP_0116123636 /NCGR_PEP_ID=MMETSP0329-20121206/4851_1 /TAXON_ID=697910 /ORGANISM="Pseudo-nitzschia arenysensis, Strain B593" /LENGTH=371 /DNA_ID=CAMNT_0003617559 /DNA_START=31 /DNA_END=1146 /DNA_ORIENTATION=+
MSATETSKLTRLDRSLALIIDEPDRTPSRTAGISADVERLHRFHGTSVIFESSRGLCLAASTCATACTIFHRIYHSVSLTEYDVWSVALASTLLATKVEEEAKSLKQIIDEYAKVYTRRILLLDVEMDDSNANKKDENLTQTTNEAVFSSSSSSSSSSKHLACLSEAISKWPTCKDRQRICATLPQSLNKHGPVYKEWHQEIAKMESILLRQLGFTFYWISDSHPHKFLLDFCRLLGLDGDKEFTQRAWEYCNESCRLDLSVRYHPEVIATATIFLTACDFGIVLPMTPRHWWQVFLGTNDSKGKDLADVANAILGTRKLVEGGDDLESKKDWLVATKGFVRPLGKTFNDSESFLWFYHKDFFDKEIQENQ